MSNVRYKDIMFENREVINGKIYVPIEWADNVIDMIYREVDDLEVNALSKLIDDIKKRLD